MAERIMIAIRDDDIGYFTKPEVLINVYADLGDFPISYGVIPYVTDVRGGCPETAGNTKPMPLGANKDITDFLKKSIQYRNCEVLQHGLTHEYREGKKGIIPEMIWRGSSELKKEIPRARAYLEDTLSCSINCFIAPSNQIKRDGMEVVIREGMNFSGLIRHFDRPINYRYFINYFRRWSARIIDGVPFPGVLYYGTHYELNACGAYSYDYLLKLYNYCKLHGYPMVTNVHHWELRDNPDLRKWFFNFIHHALQDGALPATVSQCIREFER